MQNTINHSQVAQTLIIWNWSEKCLVFFLKFCLYILKLSFFYFTDTLKYTLHSKMDLLVNIRTNASVFGLHIGIFPYRCSLKTSQRLQEALGYLVTHHCILGLEYDDPAKPIPCLCGMLFEVKPSFNSPNIKRVWSSLRAWNKRLCIKIICTFKQLLSLFISNVRFLTWISWNPKMKIMIKRRHFNFT